MKICPYCESELSDTALKCKYCGEWVTTNNFNEEHPIKLFFFDTETTGKDPKTEQIIQFGGIYGIYDKNSGEFKEINRINQLVRPTKQIPQEASNVHGLYNKDLEEYGTIGDYIYKFLAFIQNADFVVGHNVEYDKTILIAEAQRLHINFDFSKIKWIDTMKPCTNLVQIPAPERSRDKYKRPKLIELHTFLFGKGFDGAHDAMADITATKDCFIELCNNYNFYENGVFKNNIDGKDLQYNNFNQKNKTKEIQKKGNKDFVTQRFEKKIGRADFFPQLVIFQLISFVIMLILWNLIGSNSNDAIIEILVLIFFAYILFSIVIIIGLIIKRLRDIGLSGRRIIFFIIFPIFIPILFFIPSGAKEKNKRQGELFFIVKHISRFFLYLILLITLPMGRYYGTHLSAIGSPIFKGFYYGIGTISFGGYILAELILFIISLYYKYVVKYNITRKQIIKTRKGLFIVLGFIIFCLYILPKILR